MGRFKESGAARTHLRDTLGNWHPLGKWTALYVVLPSVAVLSLAGNYLGILAGLLLGAGLFVTIEYGMRRWALHRTRDRMDWLMGRAPTK